MKFWEAMKALSEGKKVRIITWEPNDKWVCNEGMTGWLYQAARDRDCNEWEIYEEPVKTFSFMEMVDHFEKYKMQGKFKRPHWEDGKFFFVDAYNHARINFYGGEPWYTFVDDIRATDWIQVKE